MKFSTTLIALVAAGIAQAQIPDVPSCALQCFLDALGDGTCDDLLDFKCQCKREELPGKITPCVKDACEIEDQISVSDSVEEQCSKAGAPIDLPPIETGEPTATEEPTAEPTEEPTEEPEEPTEEPTEPPTDAPTEPPMPTPTGTGTGGPGQPTGTGSFSNTATPTASQPPMNDAATGLQANVAGVGAALLALAAYL